MTALPDLALTPDAHPTWWKVPLFATLPGLPLQVGLFAHFVSCSGDNLVQPRRRGLLGGRVRLDPLPFVPSHESPPPVVQWRRRQAGHGLQPGGQEGGGEGDR